MQEKQSSIVYHPRRVSNLALRCFGFVVIKGVKLSKQRLKAQGEKEKI